MSYCAGQSFLVYIFYCSVQVQCMTILSMPYLQLIDRLTIFLLLISACSGCFLIVTLYCVWVNVLEISGAVIAKHPSSEGNDVMCTLHVNFKCNCNCNISCCSIVLLSYYAVIHFVLKQRKSTIVCYLEVSNYTYIW